MDITRSKSRDKSSSKSGNKSKSSSKSSSSKSASNKSSSKKVFPITESRKFPKFPKNAVFPDSEYAKREKKIKSHHALNPIVNWPSARIDVNRPDLIIPCNDPNLPQKVRTRLLDLRKSDVACLQINLKSNGTYVIKGSNGNHYVILDTSGFGKNKYSRKNKSRKNKSRKNKSRK